MIDLEFPKAGPIVQFGPAIRPYGNYDGLFITAPTAAAGGAGRGAGGAAWGTPTLSCFYWRMVLNAVQTKGSVPLSPPGCSWRYLRRFNGFGSSVDIYTDFGDLKSCFSSGFSDCVKENAPAVRKSQCANNITAAVWRQSQHSWT